MKLCYSSLRALSERKRVKVQYLVSVILIVLQNYGGLFATGLQSGGWVGVASNETENDTAIMKSSILF